MTFLRDETVAALNALIKACLDAAEMHRAVAQAIDDPVLSRRLRHLAGERDAAAEALEREVRRRDDLPAAEPHGERLILEKAIAGLFANLSGSARSEWLEHSRAREDVVRETADEALRAEPAGPLHDRLQRLRDSAAAGLDAES